MVKKLESIVYHVQRTFFIAVMTFMLLVLSLHVIMRFAFNNPIIWTDEVITMMQGTLAFAGIGYCFHKKQHTELSLVYDKVPRPVQWLFDLASNGIMLFCTCGQFISKPTPTRYAAERPLSLTNPIFFKNDNSA